MDIQPTTPTLQAGTTLRMCPTSGDILAMVPDRDGGWRDFMAEDWIEQRFEQLQAVDRSECEFDRPRP